MIERQSFPIILEVNILRNSDGTLNFILDQTCAQGSPFYQTCQLERFNGLSDNLTKMFGEQTILLVQHMQTSL